ncbi:MAG: glycosyltransferase family 2 protein [Candidatus Levybacteria bacterium]|nr:glycosyltransferase family 2 protein [Candidatus Levybacteria bacterium]
MTNFFNRIFARYPIKTQRSLSALPGFVSWTLILFPVWGSLFIPYAVAYFVLFFDIYWFYRSFSLVITAHLGSKKIKEAESKNWLEIAKSNKGIGKVNHIVIIPNFKETEEKLRRIIGTIAAQTFPLRQIFVVLAMEKREESAQKKANIIQKEFADTFGGIFVTFHPDTPGEVKGKSSNESFAAREVDKILIDSAVIDVNYATITTADADSMFDRQYFSYLSHSFLKDPKRYNRFWQAANVDHNNFWSVPAATRIFSFFSSLWRIGLLVQGDRLIPNSTYSLSFLLLKRIGYWDTDVIPEDYRVFFKAFFAMKGNISASPIFLKTSMDSPLSSTYIKSLKNKYSQIRRWSYGASDDSLFIKWWLTIPGVPFVRKTKILFHVLLDHFLWPVNWFILTIAANTITLINPVFARTTIGYNLPVLARLILASTLIALIIMVIIDYRNRPKHLSKSRLREVLFPLEFILMPIAGFFFNSLPAIISHTQIMLGRKMEYKVTEKL